MLIDNFEEVEKLNQAIDAVLTELNNTQVGSDEFAKLSDQLTKLIKNKETLATLSQKAFDARNKQDESNNTLDLKNRELQFKTQEFEDNYALKKVDSESALELKNRELEFKVREFEDSIDLKRLEHQLKKQESEKPDRVSKETLAVIGANIAGIILVLGYERVNVIASKAFSLILKSR